MNELTTSAPSNLAAALPVTGKCHLARGTMYVDEKKGWTEYKASNGITVHVNLVMDEETRAAIAVLARKADEALQAQLGG